MIEHKVLESTFIVTVQNIFILWFNRERGIVLKSDYSYFMSCAKFVGRVQMIMFKGRSRGILERILSFIVEDYLYAARSAP